MTTYYGVPSLWKRLVGVRCRINRLLTPGLWYHGQLFRGIPCESLRISRCRQAGFSVDSVFGRRSIQLPFAKESDFPFPFSVWTGSVFHSLVCSFRFSWDNLSSYRKNKDKDSCTDTHTNRWSTSCRRPQVENDRGDSEMHLCQRLREAANMRNEYYRIQ